MPAGILRLIANPPRSRGPKPERPHFKGCTFSPPALTSIVVLACLQLPTVGVAAQSSPGDLSIPNGECLTGAECASVAAVRDALDDSDRAYHAGEALEAFEILEGFALGDSLHVGIQQGLPLEQVPAGMHHRLYWRLSRAALTEAVLEQDASIAHEWARRGTERGHEALRLKPNDAESAYWLAANLGHLALYETNPRDKVAAAEEAHQIALGIVESDSLHAGAHNILGRSYLEVRQLPRRSRVLGRMFTTGDLLGTATWEGAPYHLSRAVDLEPDMIYYRVDLARYLIAREQNEEARWELQKALELPAIHPSDRALQDDAQRMLERL